MRRSITDDEVGALLADHLRRSSGQSPPINLDAIVRSGRRTRRRHAALVSTAMAGVVAATAWIAVTAATPNRQVVEVVPAGVARSSAPAPTRAPESEAATGRRLTASYRQVLQDNGIQIRGARPTMLSGQDGNGPGTFQADLRIDKAPDGEEGGVGLFATVQRASVRPPVRLDIRCDHPYRIDPEILSCATRTRPDGSIVKQVTDLDHGRSIGGAVIVKRSDGVMVAIGTTGGAYKHWPTGVTIDVLEQMATSPLLIP